MNVSLRPVEDGDLDAIYQQVTDPESIRMAAFTAEDQTDRSAFLNRRHACAPTQASRTESSMSTEQSLERLDPSESTISLEVTYWVDRAQWGRGIATAALQFFSPRLPNVRCTRERPRTTLVRFEYWRKLVSEALALTAASHAVAVRRSRKRSYASTEVAGRTHVDSPRQLR